MSLLHIILVLIVVGVLLWLLNTYGTMIDGKIKQIINVVVVVAVVLWLLSIFFGPLPDIRVGR